MDQLHPDLHRLAASYDETVAAHRAGAMTVEDAQAVIEQLRVIDGSGAVWYLDLYRRWVRHENPDAPAEVGADPALFAAPQLPPRPEEAPWMGASLAAPAGQVAPPAWGAPAAGFPAPMGAPAGMPGDPGADLSGAWQQMPGAGVIPGHEQLFTPGAPASGGGKGGLLGRLRGRGQAAAPARSLTGPAAPTGVRAVPVVGGVVGWAGRNRKMVAAIGLGAVALVGAAAHRSAAPSAATGFPAANPTSAASAPAMGTLPARTGAPAEHDKPAALPTANDGRRVVSALLSGDRSTAAGAVAAPGASNVVALKTAEFVGLTRSGITIVPGPAAKDGHGRVVQVWTYTDQSSHATYGKATVTWQLAHGQWVLTAWPSIA